MRPATASAAGAPQPAIGSLLPGDVVLMRSTGEFSTLVAWLGESEFSHAAIAVGDGMLVEAITRGVTSSRIEALLEESSVARMEAFHVSAHDGSALSGADREAVVARARDYLDRPFAGTGLLMLGLHAAMRDRLHVPDPRVRWVLERALRMLVEDDGSALVCSELVYRSLRECAVQPVGRLRPVIMARVPNPAPMPEIDGWVLLEEVAHLLGWSAGAVGKSLGGPVPQGSEQALADAHALARARLGLPPPAAGLKDMHPERHPPGPGPLVPPREVPDPVPRMVRPRDLEVSPSLRPGARIK